MNTLEITTSDGQSLTISDTGLRGLQASVTFANVKAALAAATSDVSINAHRLTSLLDPSSAQDAATKASQDAGDAATLAAAALDADAGDAATLAAAEAYADAVGVTARAYTDAFAVYVAAHYVTAVTGTGAISSSGGLTPQISIAASSALVPGTMSAADFSKLLALPSDAQSAAQVAAAVAALAATAASTYAPLSRSLLAGAGLTGGGTLAADRTFNVVANADGSIVVNADDVQVGVLASDAQHGNRGGGALHSNAVAGGAAGFLSGTDKTKLDSLTSGAAVASVTGTAPIVSSGGTTPTISISASSASTAGSMSAADFSKLAAIGAGASAIGISSAVDNEPVRFDGPDGKQLQGGTGILMSDAGAITTPNGTAALPAFSPVAGAGLRGTGNANEIALSTNSTDRLTIDATKITASIPVWVPSGIVSAPGLAFSSEASGFRLIGAGNIGLVIAGADSWNLLASTMTLPSGGYNIFHGTVNTALVFRTASTTTATIGFQITNLNSFTGSAASQVHVQIAHAINQTSTAAHTSLKISRTETALGSAAQSFLDFYGGSGGTTQVFNLSNLGDVRAGLGTQSIPSLGFIGIADKGFYSDSTNTVAFSASGSRRLQFYASGIQFFSGTGLNMSSGNSGINIQGNTTNVAAASIDLNNAAAFAGGAGIFQIATRIYAGFNQTSTASGTSLVIDQGLAQAGTGVPVFGSGGGFFADFRSNSVSIVKITNAGAVLSADGTVSLPGQSFVSSTGQGIWRKSATELAVTQGGLNVTGFDATGPTIHIYGINSSLVADASNGHLHLKGFISSSAVAAVTHENSVVFTGAAGISQTASRIAAGVNQTSTADFTAHRIDLGLVIAGTGVPVFGSGGGFFARWLANSVVNWQVTSAGVMSSTGSLPIADATSDFGTSSLQWKDLYLSGNVRGGFPVSDWAFSGLYTGGAGLVTSYASDAGVAAAVSATSVGYPQPRAVRFKNLRVNPSINTLPATATFTLYKNGSATTITCTVGAGSTSVTGDTTHTADFAVDDKLDLVVTETGIGTLAFSATIECYVA